MKRKVLTFVLLLILFLISDQPIHATSVNLFRLTSGFYREDWPIIYKNTVYWSDAAEIRGYDFKSNQESLLAKVGDQLPNDFFAPTSFDGRYLIYNTYSEARGYNVHAFDMKQNIDIAITDEIGSNTATDYDQNTVVYIEGGACGKLHAYNLNSKEYSLITVTACGPAKISGNIIVWGYAALNGSNVYGYDLNKKLQFDIATSDGVQDSPDIFGKNVVWVHSDGVNQEIHLKDLHTDKEKILASSDSYSMSWPSISKRYAVWGKNTAQHVSGVEGIDLATEEIFEIQEQGPHQNDNLSPIIKYNIAAWMAWRTGNGDIYASILNH